MNVVVFSGPTLSPLEGARELDAIYLPPASQGDVYHATRYRPRMIGLIDGAFERVPAVWHKEILWAMTQGVHVFGSASMGALRAVELEPFGMEGIGQIFEAFRSGALQDDDEVAVAHGPAETQFASCSDAMVNIRYTLRAAVDAGIIRESIRMQLEQIAKNLFYPERSYPAILDRAADAGLPGPELELLRSWLPQNQVDQKRNDALEMLRVMRERVKSGPPPKRVRFCFEHTEMWDHARRTASIGPVGSASICVHDLVEELRLVPELHRNTIQAAVVRALGTEESLRHHHQVSDAAIDGAAARLREERHLMTPSDLDDWFLDNDLDGDRFIQLLESEVRLQWFRDLSEPDAMEHLADELRVAGLYPALARRARDKAVQLGRSGLENPNFSTVGLGQEELFAWFFREHLGEALPDNPAACFRRFGFASDEDFRRAVLREFAYLMQIRTGNPAPQRDRRSVDP